MELQHQYSYNEYSELISFRIDWSEYSLEGLMLKLQYLGHLPQRADSLEKILILGKIEGKRTRWLDCITDSMDPSLSKLGEIGKYTEGQGSLACCSPCGRKELDIT